MDDNLRFPKNKIDASEALFILLNVIKKTNENLKTKEIVKIMVDENNSIINSHRLQNSSFFGKGSNHDKSFWNSLVSQASISGYIKKNIENYGVIKLNEKGIQYLKKQSHFSIYLDKNRDDIIENIKMSFIR